jgi:hypothetical protein
MTIRKCEIKPFILNEKKIKNKGRNLKELPLILHILYALHYINIKVYRAKVSFNFFVPSNPALP